MRQAILGVLWDSAPDASTLDEILRGFRSGRWDSIKNGTFVVSTSGGGYSASFSEEITRKYADQFLMLAQFFINLRQDVIADLQASGTTSPTDDQVLEAMNSDDSMEGAREFMGDYTTLRYPTYGPVR